MEIPIYKTAKEFADMFRKEYYQFMGEPDDLEIRKQALEEIYKKQIYDSEFIVNKKFRTNGNHVRRSG